MTASEFAATPLLALLVGSVATYLQARALRGRGAAWTGLTAFAFFLLAFGSAVALIASGVAGRFVLFGRVPLDAGGLAALLTIVAAGLGMAVSLYSIAYLREEPGLERYYPLLLLMAGGIVGIGYAADLFSLFVFFELMAIASYGLVAYEVRDWEPLEAGMKYVVMSATGSIVALFGISLVYLFTGTLDLARLPGEVAAMPRFASVAAIGLFVAGFGVKSAIVPMHTWLPDAHSAAPSGISAMLSGIVIQAGVLTLVKSLGLFAGPGSPASFGFLLALLAVLTMTVGNLLALHQTDLKRMLAFSSIAQVGYVLLGFGLAFEYGVRSGLEGGLFHVLNHAMMKGGAFLAAGAFLWVAGTRDLGRLAGIGRVAPAVGASFAVFSLGLAGVPPMSGFLSKLLIAKAGLDAGGAWPLFFVVALAANSVLSLSYYVPAMNRIVFAEGAHPTRRIPATMQVPIVLLAVGTILVGLFPDVPLQLVVAAAEALARLFGGA
jgi:proton-translocating NADH-quinone oxidoreductase chain N